MKIVVCVKYVPDAQGDRRFESDATVDRDGVDGLLSELDEYAVEEALKLAEAAGDDSSVTIVTMGPDERRRRRPQVVADGRRRRACTSWTTPSPDRTRWPRPGAGGRGEDPGVRPGDDRDDLHRRAG